MKLPLNWDRRCDILVPYTDVDGICRGYTLLLNDSREDIRQTEAVK